jgi:hypothetical protein
MAWNYNEGRMQIEQQILRKELKKINESCGPFTVSNNGDKPIIQFIVYTEEETYTANIIKSDDDNSCLFEIWKDPNCIETANVGTCNDGFLNLNTYAMIESIRKINLFYDIKNRLQQISIKLENYQANACPQAPEKVSFTGDITRYTDSYKIHIIKNENHEKRIMVFKGSQLRMDDYFYNTIDPNGKTASIGAVKVDTDSNLDYYFYTNRNAEFIATRIEEITRRYD